ncbi:hypothetical protein EMQ25_03940 [Arsenicitalea aurantiaca]|uniref:Uncharacterized protein n=1 Tax=Arsenicitalea aurantiaca TaxID=1783274 RepID=A0A433XM02_9HYPH|nr:hypothetical protein [Arsenicitalea aurantiaca]RUT35112.1 hypothetical protein EMQ25_03940 [Arsenicitalea aurantiaca]
MKLDRRVTGGLAWAGMFLVLAIPSADLLARLGDGEQPRAASVTPGVGANALDGNALDARTETATITPATAPAADAATPTRPNRTGDPVADFEASGRPMPSYISGGGETPARTETASRPEAPAPTPNRVIQPAGPSATAVTPDGRAVTPAPATGTASTNPATPASPTPAQPADQRTAALPQPGTTPTAPVPMPASMRPAAPVQQQQAVLPPANTTPNSSATFTRDAPLVIDEAEVAARERSTGPIPPAPIITSDQLQEWDSGSLADYLERRGLISRGGGSSASSPPQGMYLDEFNRQRGDGQFVENSDWF